MSYVKFNDIIKLYFMIKEINMNNILQNITVLRDDMKSKGWIITAFNFTYKKIRYIVVFECLDKSIKKNKYYIAQLTFINTDTDNKLITLANSIRFSIDMVSIRYFFNVEYVENLGDFEIQFYKNFAKYIPTSFHLPTHEQLDQVIDILNDRDNDNNIAMLLKETEKIRIINRCIVLYLMITKQDYYDHLYMIISKTIQL